MYTLSADTLIRPEENAALLLQRQTMETCMLSKDGLISLRDICRNNYKADNENITSFINYLLKISFIIKGNPEENGVIYLIDQLIEESQTIVSPLRSLSVPESIHIYVSNICDQYCHGCYYRYSSENPKHFMEMSLLNKIVRDAKKAKVFQIALGGGEPLLHPEILNIVKKVSSAGIICTMTTNGNKLSLEMAFALKEAGLSKMQVSLNGDNESVNMITRPNFHHAVQAIINAEKAGLKVGINYVLNKTNIRRYPLLLDKAEEWGCNSFNLLRPKEAYDDPEWLYQESPDFEDYIWLQEHLKNISKNYRTKIKFDDALCFLMADQSPDELYNNGVWGCVAGRRFLNIDPFGNIYACSHVREFDIGNGDFLLAWRSSKILERFRALDDKIEGKCATCDFKKCCRGCRAVVLAYGKDFTSEDFQCPSANIKIIDEKEVLANEGIYK